MNTSPFILINIAMLNDFYGVNCFIDHRKLMSHKTTCSLFHDSTIFGLVDQTENIK